MRALWLVAMVMLLAGCAGPGNADNGPGDDSGSTAPGFRLAKVADAPEGALLVTHAPGEDALVVAVQAGRVLWQPPTAGAEPTTLLDVTDKVRAGGEQGLLGVAFHRAWRENRMAFVSYTDTRGDSVLARYRVADDAPPRLDPESEEILLQVAQPYANHNGGHLAFGPEGLLHYGLGDGGSGGDPQNHGQDPHTLLGALLRLDVDATPGYEIPPTNPYADGRDGAPEVWATGLRNPWRFSFDRATGDLYLGDVGQNAWEEIDHLPAGHPGGANFGWPVFEGTHPYRPEVQPSSETTPPVHEYAREGERCAVTGGYVYRGNATPDLVGTYLFADYCAGTIWGMTRDAQGDWTVRQLADTQLRISSFGEDDAGEIYVVDHAGGIYRVGFEAGA